LWIWAKPNALIGDGIVDSDAWAGSKKTSPRDRGLGGENRKTGAKREVIVAAPSEPTSADLTGQLPRKR